MLIDLLLTPEIQEKMPSTTKIVENYGKITCVFEDFDLEGLHVVLEDSLENFKQWLKEFDGIAIGNGNPISQKFRIMHVKD